MAISTSTNDSTVFSGLQLRLLRRWLGPGERADPIVPALEQAVTAYKPTEAAHCANLDQRKEKARAQAAAAAELEDQADRLVCVLEKVYPLLSEAIREGYVRLGSAGLKAGRLKPLRATPPTSYAFSRRTRAQERQSRLPQALLVPRCLLLRNPEFGHEVGHELR
jgi:hypothetical protein